MRLIDTNSLELVEFTEDEIPYGRYAVLSHRWTHDEVTFKEFRKGLKTQSIGYQKIMDACKCARSRKRPYIWVDTCCIDKRSSAELSEAVNSMFRWFASPWLHRPVRLHSRSAGTNGPPSAMSICRMLCCRKVMKVRRRWTAC